MAIQSDHYERWLRSEEARKEYAVKQTKKQKPMWLIEQENKLWLK